MADVVAEPFELRGRAVGQERLADQAGTIGR